MSDRAFWCSATLCQDRDPEWRITRIGDVVAAWACVDHLSGVLTDLSFGRPAGQAFTVARRA